MVSAGHAMVVVHALLNDAPPGRTREKECVVIELITILHGGAVDFGGHAARVHERSRIERQGFARGGDLSGRLARCGSLAAAGIEPQIRFETADTLLDGSGDRRGHPTRVPVESQNTAECLEPE